MVFGTCTVQLFQKDLGTTMAAGAPVVAWIQGVLETMMVLGKPPFPGVQVNAELLHLAVAQLVLHIQESSQPPHGPGAQAVPADLEASATRHVSRAEPLAQTFRGTQEVVQPVA